jgi:hypothetical protein
VIERLPFSLAVAALLRQVSGKPVGRGRQPDDVAPPYYLLYALPATRSGAPYSDLNEDASFVYQVTCVSGPDPTKPASHGVADQAEWLADKANETFLGRDPATGLWLHDLSAPGIKVMGRSMDVEAGGTSDPGDAIMDYVLRYRFDLTSA